MRKGAGIRSMILVPHLSYQLFCGCRLLRKACRFAPDGLFHISLSLLIYYHKVIHKASGNLKFGENSYNHM